MSLPPPEDEYKRTATLAMIVMTSALAGSWAAMAPASPACACNNDNGGFTRANPLPGSPARTTLTSFAAFALPRGQPAAGVEGSIP